MTDHSPTTLSGSLAASAARTAARRQKTDLFPVRDRSAGHRFERSEDHIFTHAGIAPTGDHDPQAAFAALNLCRGNRPPGTTPGTTDEVCKDRLTMA